MMYRYGDLLKEFYDGIRNDNLPVTRMDEIQRIFNELWERDQLLGGIIYPGGRVQVQRLSTPDGSVIIEPGNFVLGNGQFSVEFGTRTSDGRMVAGGGGTIIDIAGIRDTDGNIALESFANDEVTHTILGSVSHSHYSDTDPYFIFGVHTFALQTAAGLLTNGDFETGDFTGWTEAGSPEIDDNDFAEGEYAAIISTSNTISQTLTSSPSNAYAFYLITALVKGDGTTNQYFVVDLGGSRTTYSDTALSENWTKIAFLVQANNDTTPSFTLKTSTGECHVDNVKIQQVAGYSVVGGNNLGIPNIFGSSGQQQGTALYLDGSIYLDQHPAGFGAYKGKVFTINDDAVGTSYIPSIGFLYIMGETNYSTNYLAALCNGASALTSLHIGSNTTATTGVLTGTTGTDGKLTISMNNGTLYIENRTGGVLQVFVTLI